ncbi:hypothetical protein FOL47_007880 [Perkinsus chesapeaki]|uniref:Uncharacterized protein n=1 Tax=Perkinsus chesapeaki TaxID=330153 RepID=A0A7J6LHC6_PERCH|nr:hypothetical protein FOL47_007880 [Perkinsus chesapeaki]
MLPHAVPKPPGNIANRLFPCEPHGVTSSPTEACRESTRTTFVTESLSAQVMLERALRVRFVSSIKQKVKLAVHTECEILRSSESELLSQENHEPWSTTDPKRAVSKVNVERLVVARARIETSGSDTGALSYKILEAEAELELAEGVLNIVQLNGSHNEVFKPTGGSAQPHARNGGKMRSSSDSNNTAHRSQNVESSFHHGDIDPLKPKFQWVAEPLKGCLSNRRICRPCHQPPSLTQALERSPMKMWKGKAGGQLDNMDPKLIFTCLSIGRLSQFIVRLLTGKYRVDYRCMDNNRSDSVIVVNAIHARFVGHTWDTKIYRSWRTRKHDPLGAKTVTAKHLMFHNPALPTDVTKYAHTYSNDEKAVHLPWRHSSSLEYSTGLGPGPRARLDLVWSYLCDDYIAQFIKLLHSSLGITNYMPGQHIGDTELTLGFCYALAISYADKEVVVPRPPPPPVSEPVFTVTRPLNDSCVIPVFGECEGKESERQVDNLSETKLLQAAQSSRSRKEAATKRKADLKAASAP